MPRPPQRTGSQKRGIEYDKVQLSYSESSWRSLVLFSGPCFLAARGWPTPSERRGENPLL